MMAMFVRSSVQSDFKTEHLTGKVLEITVGSKAMVNDAEYAKEMNSAEIFGDLFGDDMGDLASLSDLHPLLFSGTLDPLDRTKVRQLMRYNASHKKRYSRRQLHLMEYMFPLFSLVLMFGFAGGLKNQLRRCFCLYRCIIFIEFVIASIAIFKHFCFCIGNMLCIFNVPIYHLFFLM